MKRQKSKPRQKRTGDALLKQVGFQREEAFRRSDLTSEVREKTGITPEEEFQLAAVAELHRLGLPLEVAKALGFSRAIGTASELATLKAEEVEQILGEPAVKKMLPQEFEVSAELVEQWLRRVQPLAADEDALGRSEVTEDQEQGAASEDDTALAAEDESLSRQTIDELVAALRDRLRSGEAALQALARREGGTAEAPAVRDVLLGLQTGISSITERLSAREVAGFAAVDEEQAAALADDALEPARDIQLLEDELKRMQARIDDIRTLAESGDEDRSAAAATEESQEDVEVRVRGE